MLLETWIAFAVASTALLIVPGPTVMIVVSYALSRGRPSAWATVPGAVLADFTAMTMSLIGAGAILAASAALFTVLKLLGAVYLIWLGNQLWQASPSVKKISGARQESSKRSMFWNCYIVTALNPKSIVFFIAFGPSQTIYLEAWPLCTRSPWSFRPGTLSCPQNAPPDRDRKRREPARCYFRLRN